MSFFPSELAHLLKILGLMEKRGKHWPYRYSVVNGCKVAGQQALYGSWKSFILSESVFERQCVIRWIFMIDLQYKLFYTHVLSMNCFSHWNLYHIHILQ